MRVGSFVCCVRSQLLVDPQNYTEYDHEPLGGELTEKRGLVGMGGDG